MQKRQKRSPRGLAKRLRQQRLRHRPAALALSRQPLPTLDRTRYAPASGVAPTAEELVAHVAARLADYKKPRGIVFVPEVRRSPSGKADLRWALAAASGDQAAGIDGEGAA